MTPPPIITPAEIKNKIKNLKILHGPNHSVLFDKTTLNLRRLPAGETNLEKLIAAIDHIPDNSPQWEKIAFLVNHFTEIPLAFPKNIEGEGDFNKLRREDEQKLESLKPSRHLYKLSINTANACNLRCVYCYAAHGKYGESKSFLMSLDHVEQTLRRFARHYDYISRIQFMGGEPSLHPMAIQKTHEVCAALVNEGLFKEAPKLGLVSNGLKFSKKFWEIAKKTQCSITFSLDGPKNIHDAIRPKPDGSGSYDQVVATIRRAREEGLSTNFEATFTKRHLVEGMHLSDLCQWFFDEFKQRVLHAPSMGINKHCTDNSLGFTQEEKAQEYCAVTEWGLDNLAQGKVLMHSFTERFLVKLIKKDKSVTLCPAGNDQLSVATNGDVFPCWQFIEAKPFYMGNVTKDDFLGAKGAAVASALADFDLAKRPECQTCWIQPLCFGCTGNDYLATGQIDQRPECPYMLAMAETVILKTVEVLQKLKANPPKKPASPT